MALYVEEVLCWCRSFGETENCAFSESPHDDTKVLFHHTHLGYCNACWESYFFLKKNLQLWIQDTLIQSVFLLLHIC